jgi:PEP-CTERM motif
MKKSLISKAIALALVLAGSTAAHAVMIDLMGTSGTGPANAMQNPNGGLSSSVRNVTGLDWNPDNAIAIGALSTPTLGAIKAINPLAVGVDGQANNEAYIQNVAQGTLASFKTTAGGPSLGVVPSFVTGREFTFVASFYTFTSGIGTATVANRLAPGQSYFRIYADTNQDSNVVAGTGYDNGTLILEGTLSALNGTFTDQTRLGQPGNGVTQLDGYDEDGNGTAADDDKQSGVLSHVGNGSNTLTVDITTLNTSYFLGSPALIQQLLLTLNYNDTTNLATPFISTSPSDSVVGVVPSYSVVGGNKTNGGDCFSGGQTGGQTEAGVATPGRCDFHFQSDASGSFLERPLPEPTSLALVGLAFAGAGFAARRRAKKA